MKRCLIMALVLSLLMATALPPALAEDAEIISAGVEPEVAPAELAGGIGLTIEGEALPEQLTESNADELADIDLADLFGDADSDTAVQAAEAAPAAEAAIIEEKTPKAATGIQLSAKKITIGVKEKYTGLAVIAVPEDSILPDITWRSGNKKIVKVNSKTGAITGVKTGSASVYAKIKGGKEVKCKVTVKKKPKKVTLDITSASLSVGMDAQLTASVPKGYASGALTFESSKPKVAAVDETGRISALKKGSATITVKTYNGKTAKCKVSVKKAPAAVSFPCEGFSIAVKQKAKLRASALTSKGDTTPATIAYAIDEASPNAGCIKLDAEAGTVTGVKKGQAIVTATTQNGRVASFTVTVDVAPKSVKLNQSSITIGVKEVYTELVATTVAPKGSTSCANVVTWSSSNKKIAKVNSTTGKITGVKEGTCTIKVKTSNGKKAKCKVTVKKAPKSISVKPENGALKVGQTGKYEVTLSPKGCADRVSYKSSDASIAEVDDKGYVTAIAPGEVTITVSTYNGKKKKVSLIVSENEDEDDTGSDGSDGGKTSPANAKKLEYMITVAQSQLGKPYVYGSGYSKDANPKGFDCSGFAYWCFLHLDIKLKDTAYKQGYDDSMKKITSKKDLRRGDLVFFDTVKDSDLSDHTGIYLGEGKFIHASSSAKKVIVSDMSQSGSYYDRTFSWGRRVLD